MLSYSSTEMFVFCHSVVLRRSNLHKLPKTRNKTCLVYINVSLVRNEVDFLN